MGGPFALRMPMLSSEAFKGLTGSRKTYTLDAEFDA